MKSGKGCYNKWDIYKLLSRKIDSAGYFLKFKKLKKLTAVTLLEGRLLVEINEKYSRQAICGMAGERQTTRIFENHPCRVYVCSIAFSLRAAFRNASGERLQCVVKNLEN